MAGAAIVGRDSGVAQQLAAGGMIGVAEAHQHDGVVLQLVLPDRQRGDAHAPTYEQRGPPVGRRRESDPERAHQRQLVTLVKLAQALGAWPDILDEEVQLVTVSRSAQHAERARQVGPLIGPSPPPLRRHQHVELAACGRGPDASAQRSTV